MGVAVLACDCCCPLDEHDAHSGDAIQFQLFHALTSCNRPFGSEKWLHGLLTSAHMTGVFFFVLLHALARSIGFASQFLIFFWSTGESEATSAG